MMHRIESEITRLTDSFRLGNAIKKGWLSLLSENPTSAKAPF